MPSKRWHTRSRAWPTSCTRSAPARRRDAVIGFAKIAGGMPSSTGDMTKHLLTQTLPAEEARLAAYYERGMIHDNAMLSWANLVAEGRVYYGDAVDQLMRDY